MKLLSQWLNVNRLALNVKKTNFVIFRSNRKPANHNVVLILNRKALAQKDHVKYLGILMDQHLSWKYQISHVSKKVSRGVGILSKLRHFLDSKLLVNIYYCLVYSYLNYGILAWGSACPTDTKSLLILSYKKKLFEYSLETNIFKYMGSLLVHFLPPTLYLLNWSYSNLMISTSWILQNLFILLSANLVQRSSLNGLLILQIYTLILPDLVPPFPMMIFSM